MPPASWCLHAFHLLRLYLGAWAHCTFSPRLARWLLPHRLLSSRPLSHTHTRASKWLWGVRVPAHVCQQLQRVSCDALCVHNPCVFRAMHACRCRQRWPCNTGLQQCWQTFPTCVGTPHNLWSWACEWKHPFDDRRSQQSLCTCAW